MPRRMPRFDVRFANQARIATQIIRAGEISRSIAGMRSGWTDVRLEFLYELAYLRVFIAWETVLESVFLRSLCGYASKAAGREAPACGRYYGSIARAESAVLVAENKTYLLWHNASQIVKRCKKHIGTPIIPGVQETVIASNSARLSSGHRPVFRRR